MKRFRIVVPEIVYTVYWVDAEDVEEAWAKKSEEDGDCDLSDNGQWWEYDHAARPSIEEHDEEDEPTGRGWDVDGTEDEPKFTETKT